MSGAGPSRASRAGLEPDPQPLLAPRRIVVGFDGSPPSARAARLAFSVVSPNAGRLWFVHAILPDRRRAEPITEEEMDSLSRSVIRGMETLVREAQGFGIVATSVSRVGSPPDVLIGAAREFAAELVIVGTRGRGDTSRVILGSVSSQVVARSSVPVVVVP